MRPRGQFLSIVKLGEKFTRAINVRFAREIPFVLGMSVEKRGNLEMTRHDTTRHLEVELNAGSSERRPVSHASIYYVFRCRSAL